MGVKKRSIVAFVLVLFIAFAASAENVKLRVVAVNPSDTENKITPIKIYLPEEVKPGDIIDQGILDLEYDSNKKIYYVYDNEVELEPKETKVFEVIIQDVWRIPKDELDALRIRTSRIVGNLEDTDYYGKAAAMAESVYERLREIAVSQDDESVSREKHIGRYRTNIKVVDDIEEDIDRLERLLIYIGGPPAPEMLEESDLKADAPSKTTTWLIIFIIMGFIGLLAVVFFFTWHNQSKITEEVMLNARKTSFKDFAEEENEEDIIGDDVE